MSKDDSCGTGAVLIAFILGAIAGAGAAALLSPTSGPENRRRITEIKDGIIDKTDSLRENVMNKADDAVERGKTFIDKQKGVISSAIEAGKDAYEKEKESRPAQDEA